MHVSSEILSREQEVELAKRIEMGDSSARKKMIEMNMRLAMSMARKYARQTLAMDDLMQESFVGLIKAVDKFDWRRGLKFSTYASWWIKQCLQRHVASHSTGIRMPSHARRLQWRVKNAVRDYREQMGESPTNEIIAEALNVSVSLVSTVSECPTIAIQISPNSADSMPGGSVEIVDETSTPDLDVEAHHDSRVIMRALGILSPKEEQIIRMRYGFGTQMFDGPKYMAKPCKLSRKRKRK